MLRECSPHTMCQVSCVMCNLSPVTCQMSYVFSSFFLSFFIRKQLIRFFLTLKIKIAQSGGASWWRVSYQRGLHRLVINTPP